MSDEVAPSTSKTSSSDDAGLEKPPTIVEEFIYFLKYEKKWWIGFIVVILGILSALIFMTESTAVMPFIYTIF